MEPAWLRRSRVGSRGAQSGSTASTVTSPPGQLVFSDDFSNPQSGWVPDNNQDDNGSASYVNGGYQVTALKPDNAFNTFSVSSPFTTTLTSMASQADAAMLNGTPADGAGVRCDQGSRNGLRYTFQVNGDQTWVIFKLGVSGQPVVAQGRSSAIHAASAPNTITGQCTEVSNGATHLVMTVNGVVVGSATDSVIPAAHARAAHAALPNSELVIFDDGRHEPHRSHASEFAVALTDFLTSHSVGY